MNVFSNLKLKKVNHPVVKASGSVLVSGTVEVKFTLMNGKSGLFVSLPSREYKNKENEKKYEQQVIFPDKNVQMELQKLVISEYNSGSEKSESAGDGTPF